MSSKPQWSSVETTTVCGCSASTLTPAKPKLACGTGETSVHWPVRTSRRYTAPADTLFGPSPSVGLGAPPSAGGLPPPYVTYMTPVALIAARFGRSVVGWLGTAVQVAPPSSLR